MTPPQATRQGQHRALLDLARSQAISSGDLETAFAEITATAARVLKVARASVWLYSEDSLKVRCADLYEPAREEHSRGHEIIVAEHPAYFKALDENRMIEAADVRHHPLAQEFLQNYIIPLGITAALVAPVFKGGMKAGVVCFEDTCSPRPWSADEQDFAILMADMVSLALEARGRKEALDALRESEIRYRALVEQVPAVTYVAQIEGEGSTLFISPQIEVMTGYTAREWLSQPSLWYQSLHPEDRERVMSEIAGLDAVGKAFDGEYRMADRQGRTHWVHDKAVVVGSADGKALLVQGILLDVSEQKRSEEERRTLTSLVENSTDCIAVASLNRRIQYLNGAGLEMIGLSGLDEARRLLLEDFVPGEERGRVLGEILPETLERGSWRGEISYRKRTTGQAIPVDIRAFVIRATGTDRPIALATVGRDISERKAAETALRDREEQLRHAQRLESIGTLAGGVAHDFNNLLTTIIGNARLLHAQLPGDDPSRGQLEGMLAASEKAAALTRQLLAFSRKQVMQPRVIDLNASIRAMEGLLRQLIGEQIDLVTTLEPCLGRVEADPNQIEQVIMNLAVNARDAMPHGGLLTIGTRNVRIEPPLPCGGDALEPGPYVVLSVADSGTGMTEDVRTRVFEPFFTTKATGHGTGLGLSTVYGIVAQSGGRATVRSEPGLGSCFEIHLPATENPLSTIDPPPDPFESCSTGRGEAVLVVEDEDNVREVVCSILERAGYRVLTARSGDEALALLVRTSETIDMLVTDMVMPGMGGGELARRFRTLHPGAGILCASGYGFDGLGESRRLGSDVEFLQKPFSPIELARKVREVLDRAPRSAGAQRR